MRLIPLASQQPSPSTSVCAPVIFSTLVVVSPLLASGTRTALETLFRHAALQKQRYRGNRNPRSPRPPHTHVTNLRYCTRKSVFIYFEEVVLLQTRNRKGLDCISPATHSRYRPYFQIDPSCCTWKKLASALDIFFKPESTLIELHSNKH